MKKQLNYFRLSISTISISLHYYFNLFEYCQHSIPLSCRSCHILFSSCSKGRPFLCTMNISPFQILASVSPKKSLKSPFVAPSGGFAPAASIRRTVCHLVQLSRAILYPTLPCLLPACLSTFLLARMYHTRDMVCLRAGTTS